MRSDQAASAFSQQSTIFDQIYGPSPIVQFMRKRIREVFMPHLEKGKELLEINGGTGEDSLYFDQKGLKVTYSDVADGMVEQASRKFEDREIGVFQADYHALPFESGSFDAVFSNLGGLNCTKDLSQVQDEIDRVLRPGGIACLVVMTPGSWWENLSWLKGNRKMATRRRKKNGTPSKVDGVDLTVWYHSPGSVKKHWKNWEVLSLNAVCVVVPPEHMRHRIVGRERLMRWLEKGERSLSGWPLIRNMGDCFVIVIKKPG